MHPNVSVLDEKNQFFNKLIFIDADATIENPESLLEVVNSILQKLTQIFAIKQNDDFLNFFGIGPDSKSPGASDLAGRQSVTKKGGSLLRQIVSQN